MDKKEELIRVIMEFVQEVNYIDEKYNAVVFSEDSITVSTKDHVKNIAENNGMKIDEDEFEDNDLLFIRFDNDEEEEGFDPNNGGYLQ